MLNWLKLCKSIEEYVLSEEDLREEGRKELSQVFQITLPEGNEVTIINLFKTEQFYQLENGIEVIWPKTERTKHNRLVYAFLILPFLRRAIRKTKPDVLLGFGEWFNPFVILATLFLGVPLYVFDRMGPLMKMDPVVSISRRILYRYAKGVIVQTNTAAAIVAEKTGARNISVVPNPVNPIDADTSVKKNQIVSLGRLSREKGHIVLIRAFSRLKQKEWSLHLIGDGPERQNLENEVISLGLSERVKFYGHMKDLKGS